MRSRFALTGAVLAALAVVVLASASGAASAGTTTHVLSTPGLVPNPAAGALQLGRPGLGATHWFGRGHYGWWGKRAARPQAPKTLLSVDQLQNPGNGEIMPTTNTYLIFWLPAGFHYGDSGGDAAYEAAMQTYF